MREGMESNNEDDHIARRWKEEVGRRAPIELTTAKGVRLRVTVDAGGIMEYHAHLPSNDEVATIVCARPQHGHVQIANANVFEVDGVDYRRKGIGTALYDLIERDVHAAGGRGIEPEWGHLSEDAVAFWKARRPELAAELDERGRPVE